MKTKPPAKLIRAGLLAGSALCSAGAPVLKAVATESVDPLQSAQNESSELEAIVVTATRRATNVLEIPYNISAVTGDTLEKLGVSNITQLSQVMPGLDYPNQGAGRDAFTQPIIRGLNLSSPTNQYYPPGEVAPVSTYIGDTPVTGRFPVNDLERVEVLRGPQGTLYGAGAIAGTIRMIPNDPKIGEFSGRFESNASSIDNSHAPSYGFDGVVNVPINDMLAFRLSGEYQRDAGYINYTNVVERQTSSPLSAPVLANPSDVAGSPGIRTSVGGANWSENYGGRAALLIQPADGFKAVLSLRYEHELGGGNNGVSYGVKGGADAIFPTITLAAPGKYDNLNYSTEPYWHDASLPTLDVSRDLGFATLSSNTSYFDGHGTAVSDQTLLTALFAPAIAVYYTGMPVFPRFTASDVLSTTQRDFTEELRLVSNGKSTIDYVVGLFFQHHEDSYSTLAYTPGAAAWDAATPAPIVPIVVYANDLGFFEDTQRSSLDRALYGEVTYHVTPTIQVTGGGRLFWQTSATSSQIGSSAFAVNVTDSNTFSDHGELGKMNASWDYVTDHRVYATFSQGYRPGGANGIPLAGGMAEVPALRTYSPDHVNNYEIGGKGSFGSMLAYTVDIYDMELQRAQLSTVTPSAGFPVVVNTNGARTRGAELELNGRLIDHLSYRAGYSYTDAKLTQAFAIATANDGTIGGVAGARLPGSAKVSWSGSLTYDLPIGNFTLATTAGVSHKGSVGNSLPSANSYFTLPGYTLANLNVTLSENSWHVTAFANNVTNELAFTAGSGPKGPAGPQGALVFIETPREIGMRVGYAF